MENTNPLSWQIFPGLKEGGKPREKGVGHQFLKHIERNKILLFLIDILDEILKTLLISSKKN
ncbi:MAG: hypothetical protein Ct9H300mP24_3310 [Candidatus Neomarinimicrobiota bacterium]|nr:MAG: hypothetical protein Ct9H300mP24_3310 [Candidatus Neomarinimicrobiota bacterium]